MVVINVVYYFGYCRNVAPPSPLLPTALFSSPSGEMRGRIRFTYSRDWHRPNRSATAGSFYFYRHRRFNGEEKNPAKLQQQPYIEAMHVPSSRP